MTTYSSQLKREIAITALVAAVLVVFGLYLTGCELNLTNTQEQEQGDEVPTAPQPVPEAPAPPVPIAEMRLATFGGGCGEDSLELSASCGVGKAITCSALDADGNHLGDPEGLVYKPEWHAAPPIGLSVSNVNLWNARIETEASECYASVICTVRVDGYPELQRSIEKFFTCVP